MMVIKLSHQLLHPDSSSGTVIKKQKKISSLDGYVDYPLSDEQAKLANDLEANFAWVPPLAAEPQDVDDLLAGPETISADEIAKALGALEAQENLEEFMSIDNTEVLGGKAFDFAELEWLDRGIVPQAAVDEVDIMDHNVEDDGWDEASLMSLIFCDKRSVWTDPHAISFSPIKPVVDWLRGTCSQPAKPCLHSSSMLETYFAFLHEKYMMHIGKACASNIMSMCHIPECFHVPVQRERSVIEK
ncbi:hypothetical protein F4604DRAFT_1682803 [Suillus subluteus]|nr:hypothetical protein F4604DRAFT_1682803 [Suillus subluteus]